MGGGKQGIFWAAHYYHRAFHQLFPIKKEKQIRKTSLTMRAVNFIFHRNTGTKKGANELAPFLL